MGALAKLRAALARPAAAEASKIRQQRQQHHLRQQLARQRKAERARQAALQVRLTASAVGQAVRSSGSEANLLRVAWDERARVEANRLRLAWNERLPTLVELSGALLREDAAALRSLEAERADATLGWASLSAEWRRLRSFGARMANIVRRPAATARPRRLPRTRARSLGGLATVRVAPPQGLAKAVNTWLEFLDERQRLRAFGHRLMKRGATKAINTWYDHADEMRRMRGVAARALNSRLAAAWNQWSSIVDEVARMAHFANRASPRLDRATVALSLVGAGSHTPLLRPAGRP